MKLRFSFIVSLFTLISAIAAVAQETFPCVWRNPERTMTKIFPDAADYKSVNVPISPAQRAVIEKKLGHPLLPGQEKVFAYYEMTGKGGKRVGYILAPAQKGEYGAVEFVFGLDTAFVLKGIYVQRSRERDASFKERAFLDRFLGKTVHDAEKLRAGWKGAETPGVRAVFDGLRKELLLFGEMVTGKGG